MIDFNNVTNENIKEYYLNWPQIPEHSYRVLIIRGSESTKRNLLFNLVNEEPDIDKNYLYAKDLYEAKDLFWISKRESTDLKNFNDSKVFMEYSNDMHGIYNKIKEYNPNKKWLLIC